MNIIGKVFTKEQFTEYVKGYDFGSIPPTKLVIHHTWKPTKDAWGGKRTLEGIKRYYEGKGWYAGPHIFVAEDGIWLFTPMNEVGIHAGKGNGSWKWSRKTPTWYSLGIEVVGDYDTRRWEGKTKENALHVIKTLRDTLEINNEDTTFHRDYSNKTCPGEAITKDWLFQELENMGRHSQGEPSPWAVDGWNWQQELGLDLTVHPHQQVSAEWVFAILKKLNDLK